MTKSKLYTVYDRVAEEFSPLATQKNDAVAIRSFRDVIGDKNNPGDYYLVRVGEFFPETGVLDVYPYQWDILHDCEFDVDVVKSIGVEGKEEE